jgi:hypothetical protein
MAISQAAKKILDAAPDCYFVVAGLAGGTHQRIVPGAVHL